MWISRSAEACIRDRLQHHPAVALTGARQTGKTSLARRVAPDFSYVSLDLPSEAEQAESAPEDFIARHPEPLIIDEVQYAPALFRHLKVVIDEDRNRPGRFLLTGSQPFALMQSLAESLAGRVSILQIEGLSWAEIHAAYPDLPIEEAVVRGGFPELYRDLDMHVAGYHQSYLATYLERDLRSLLAVGSLRDFERFLHAAALRTATVLNRSDLARDVGISHSTARAWLSALEASGQVTHLEPWFGNATKRLVKSPKLHLTDSGTACFLAGIRHADELCSAPLAGAIWESATIAEARRALEAAGGAIDLHYWRDRTKEADLLLHRGGAFRLADANWTQRPKPEHAAVLKRIATEFPAGSVHDMALFTRAGNRHTLADGTEALDPWSIWEWIVR